MFVIKFHGKGHKTKYSGRTKAVVNKKYAWAIGENYRERFEKLQNEHCTLVTIKCSNVAEIMYASDRVLVKDIAY